MNRRDFLKRTPVLVAAIATLPVAISKMVEPPVTPGFYGLDYWLNEYKGAYVTTISASPVDVFRKEVEHQLLFGFRYEDIGPEFTLGRDF